MTKVFEIKGFNEAIHTFRALVVFVIRKTNKTVINWSLVLWWKLSFICHLFLIEMNYSIKYPAIDYGFQRNWSKNKRVYQIYQKSIETINAFYVFLINVFVMKFSN